jgi:diguanylate cyclase
LEQSDKIEQATTLSDIKEMKNTLQKVVKEVRRKVQEKQSIDDQHIEILKDKVKSLSGELEKAKKGTLRDGLTGIYNFNTLEKYIRKVVEKNTVEDAPFSMVAMDIDEFDKIIENYGRNLSDRVVLAISEKCREFLRTGDFAARYKGGVFVMILPGESLKKAAKRAKQFCKAISKNKYTLDDMQSTHVLSFTISMGITGYISGDTAGTVTRRSLEALSSAKKSGGNRVDIVKR